jgi:DNA-binding transcriptional LysR family regulator
LTIVEFSSHVTMLKLQQVRQLTLAAATGSFRHAADATFRSPAAVSLALRELEKTIGAPLIEPSRRGRLTPLAHALLPLFNELLAVHDVVLARARQLAQGEHGSLSIAVAPFLAEQWLPDLLAGFLARYPGVRIRTIEERSSHIRGLVADGTVDIGIAGMLAGDPGLTIVPVANDAYGVLCSRSHRFARQRSVAWAALHGERLIGSDALEALVRAGHAPPLPACDLVITSRAPLLACVGRGLGVTVLPMLTRPESADLVFVPLRRPTLGRTVAVITRNSETLLPAGRALVELLAESLRAFARRRGARAASG